LNPITVFGWKYEDIMTVYAVGLLVSILIYMVVGNYAGRKVKHLDDYFVAGRNAPTLLIVGTLVASFISTNAFMGETGQAYSGYGGVVLMITIVNVVGYVVGGLYFGRFLRRSRSLTVAEYFGHRFGSRRVQVVAGATIIFGCTAYLMTVSQGAATIINEVTGLPFGATLFIAWLSYTLFTLYSGSRGVILTDTIMFLLFVSVAFVGVAFIVEDAGGWWYTIQELATFESKPGVISWHGMNTVDATWTTPAEAMTYAIILGLGWSMVVAVSPWQASRYLMARDEHTVIRSATIAAAAIMFFYLALMLAAAAMNLIKPDINPAQEVMIWAAINVMPTAVGVAVMAGIMAAALSSASTFLSLIGFSVSNDIFPKSLEDDKRQLRLSRLAMFICSLAALALAWLVPQGYIFWLTYFAGTLFASAWGPMAFMSVWSRRITEAGAFWGIIAGLAGNIGTNLVKVLSDIDLPEILNPILVGAVLSYLAIEIVSRSGTVSEAEHEKRLALHSIPAGEQDQKKIRMTLLWAGVVIGAGFLISIGMAVFYAIPYDLALSGRPAVFSAASIFSLMLGLSVVACGVWAWQGTRNSYDTAQADSPPVASNSH
jgi:sodium/pantothenate symporter